MLGPLRAVPVAVIVPAKGILKPSRRGLLIHGLEANSATSTGSAGQSSASPPAGGRHLAAAVETFRIPLTLRRRGRHTPSSPVMQRAGEIVVVIQRNARDGSAVHTTWDGADRK